MKLMCLCDSPTGNTGFGRVAAALLKRWRSAFEVIDVWGINHNGNPHLLPYGIYPATPRGGNWHDVANLQAFTNHVNARDYTHIWILQDTFMLVMWKFSETLADLVAAKKIKLFYYFPVDAPLEANWCKIITAANCPVAYTDYGREEALKHLGAGFKIEVIPHGVDTEVFRPINLTMDGMVDRATARQESRRSLLSFARNSGARFTLKGFTPEWLADDDFLLINVNQNQRRKDIVRSLQILQELRQYPHGHRFKLLLHMNNKETDGQHTDLELMGEQLGLTRGVQWQHTGELFAAGSNHPLLPEGDVNRLYNAADVYLTTTLGEGWGLGITEALAAGCMVAVPAHTACLEIYELVREHQRKGGSREGSEGSEGSASQNNSAGQSLREAGGSEGGRDSMVLLPLEDHAVSTSWDNSRLRYRVNVQRAAERIYDWCMAKDEAGRPYPPARLEFPEGLRAALDWDTLAAKWLTLFKTTPLRQRLESGPDSLPKIEVLQ